MCSATGVRATMMIMLYSLLSESTDPRISKKYNSGLFLISERTRGLEASVSVGSFYVDGVTETA